MTVDVRRRRTRGINRARLSQELSRSAAPALVTLVGALLGLGAFLFIVSQTSAGVFSGHTELRFEVDDATAVVPADRDEVRVHGIPAGAISRVDLEDGRPVLTVTIDPAFGPFHRDMRARLRPNTALQDMYLDIVDRGTPAAGRASADDPIPAARTDSSVNVAEVLQTFDPSTREHLSSLLHELGGGLEERGDDLRQSFVEVVPFLAVVDDITTQVARRTGQTRRLVTNTARLTEELARRDTQVERLVEDGGTTLRTLADGSADLDRTLAALPPTVGQLDRSLAAVRGVLGDVDGAVRALRPVAAALPAALPAVERLAGSAGPAVRALRRPVVALRPLARDLRPLAAYLSRGLAALAPQVADIDKATASVAGCRVTVQRFFQWTPSVFKLGDAKGVGPRADVTLGVESSGVARDPRVFAGESCAPGKPIADEPAEEFRP